MRRSYSRLLAVFSLFLAFVLVLPVIGAVRMAGNGAGTTVAVGTAAVVVAFGLLIGSVLQGRAAVIGDEVALGAMRFSGVLARAAQISGLTGAALTLAVSFVQRKDADLNLLIGIVLGLCLIAPFVFGNTVRLPSLRFTAGPA